MTKAELAGRDAYKAGLTLDANPHDPVGAALCWFDWCVGWHIERARQQPVSQIFER